MIELHINSSIDNNLEPSLFYQATSENRPLLVVLHTWSFDRFNQKDIFWPYAKQLNWNLLLPEFRGPNTTENPRAFEACGSHLAKQDIIDAINYVLQKYKINQKKIFLFGNSGGGHMSLLMAAFAPELFKAIVANCSVTDLEKWRTENPNYTKHVDYCLHGSPDNQNIAEYHDRSPIYHLAKISKAFLKITHGKHDRSVPYQHSEDLYHAIIKKYPTAKITFELTDMGHECNHDDVINHFLKSAQEKTTFIQGGFSKISK